MPGAEGATAPGISQAKGPRRPDSLESVPGLSRGAAEGVKPGQFVRCKALRPERQTGVTAEPLGCEGRRHMPAGVRR